MKNDYDDGTLRLSIPPTLLVSAMGKIPDIEKAITSDFKAPGDAIYLLGATHVHMGGSEYHRLLGWHSPYCPTVNGRQAIALYRALHQAIMNGWIRSCHDLSEGGLAIALAESVIGSPYGASVSIEAMVEDSPELRWDDALFCESPSRFVVSVSPEYETPLADLFTDLPWLPLGHVSEAATLQVTSPQGKILIDAPRETLAQAWQRSPAACWDEPSQTSQGGGHHG
jgi:phosphoribosylformylglycinamidine (FGAM) synthase-like enzyme